MAISTRGVVRSTSCLVLRWGFRGRRIEWRYFRFRQIQDGGCRHLEKFKWRYLRGGPSDLLLVCLWGFRGRRILMALIPVWPISIGMWEKTMREE